MLIDEAWLRPSDGLAIELRQSRDEGRDVAAFEPHVRAVLDMPHGEEREDRATQLYAHMACAPTLPGHPYVEPDDIDAIRRERPAARTSLPAPPAGEALYDRVYGAWLGRCCGCLLGQPVEGWRRDRLVGLLRATDNYPIARYLSSDIAPEIREAYGVRDDGSVYGSAHINWINHVRYMPEDDDTNYTVMGLKILSSFGRDFTSDDVARAWLGNLPLLHVCTAERVAYQNLTNLVVPPRSARHRNPYREYIGAQIRADFFGYINPGDPEAAADMAHRDARISHVKNGIYGEMMVAAMVAAALTGAGAEAIVEAGCEQIPERSRMYAALRGVCRTWRAGGSMAGEIERIHGAYDESDGYDWCHAISNAEIVCAALLYAGDDFERAIGSAVEAGFDTDCNGATVGSIVGARLGASRLPDAWTAPLRDTLRSGVDGFGMGRISELARRTLEFLPERNRNA